MDAALSAADAGGLAVAQEHDVAVAMFAAARARDSAIAGDVVAAAAGRFPPPYHIPASINTPHGAGFAAVSTGAPQGYKPPPTDRVAPSILLPAPTPAGQAPQPDDLPAEGDKMDRKWCSG